MTIKMFDMTWKVNTEIFVEGFDMKPTEENITAVMDEIGFDECYCSEWLELE